MPCVIPGAGSVLVPIRKASIARAAPRPSLMAQTTSDWPRRQSPAAKTPGDVRGERAVLGFEGFPVAARPLRFDAEHFADRQFRAEEAGGQQHEVGGPDLFAAGHFAERRFLARLRPIDERPS